jgi:hypothetical protein
MGFVARFLVIGIAVFVLYAAFAALGRPVWAFPVAMVFLLVVHGARIWRTRRSLGARADAWTRAQGVPSARAKAIDELKKVLVKTTGGAADGDGSTRAKLSVLLSELLQVSGDFDGARDALAAVDEGALSPGDRAGMTYARALLSLRSGDPDAAREILGRQSRLGLDDGVALRLELLDAAAELEVGDPETALQATNAVRKRAGGDESLATEARVVRAAALDALGRREEAVQIMRDLGGEARAAIAAVGLPRAQSLVDAVETPFRGTA